MAYNPGLEAEEQGSSNPAFSVPSILRTIWKRKVRITVTWFLLTICVLAIVRMLPAVYLSEALILIDSQKIPEKFVSATVASDLDDRIATIREMLLSSGELNKVIDDFGLYKDQRKKHFDEEILDMMRKDISITLESVDKTSSNGGKRTAAFRIGYQGSDPQLVMRVANRLTDLYVEQNLKTRESQAAGTSDFLETQLQEAKKRLDELEAKVSSYKLAHAGALPEQEQSLSSTLSRLQTELEANRDAINRTQQTKVVQEGTLTAMQAAAAVQTMRSLEVAPRAIGAPEAGTGVRVANRTYGKVSEALEAQLSDLLTKVTEKHSDVIKLRAAIEAAKREEQLEDTKEAALKAEIAVTNKELEGRTAEQQRILRDIDQYQRRIEQVPAREQEMEQLTRDFQMSQENYKSLLDKKLAAEMALDMERRQQSERFTVLDRARVPEKPIKPKRPMLYAVGSGLALVLGLLVGFTAEMRRNVVLGEWELPQGITVLARLPYIEVSLASSAQEQKTGKHWFSRKKALADAPLGG